ncbi:Protein NorD [Rhodovastum atsumiense]|uniref:VWA domain-containing protein n=1 Tax=Rhodovastum atsumiense TaxID=504468 RepID=A0A5M6ISN8_9PROT|nr:VWA domain-containing protein [Rhodovastum atsumiense]KAA5611326.1 VWA domain-containing protein [Rhodovastum atsumiense]CAH2601803.1 Protein NorD [Rhodovastum atsumiense]
MPWFLEPEETIGHAWHRLVGDAASWTVHPDATVSLDAMRGRLGVLFRALGGAGTVRIAPVAAIASRHRTGLRARLGLGGVERLEQPCFDGATLMLPPVLAVLERRADNEALYEWLAAWFALAEATPPALPADPLQADVARLRRARTHTARLLAQWPGLRPLHARLAASLRALRHRPKLAGDEAAMEAAVRIGLGEAAPDPLPPRLHAMLDPTRPVAGFRAGRRYRPFLPVPLWGEVVAPETGPTAPEDSADAHGAAGGTVARRQRARRRDAGQTRRRDPLVLNRFETILGLAEMMNLARPVEDDDAAAARQAAEDLDELALIPQARRAATRLRMDPHLPQAEVAAEPLLAATLTYPEWDHRRGAYHPDHCRVIVEPAATEAGDWHPDAAARRRIRRVRRQFEALRPRRRMLQAQPDGEELDLPALVRAVADCRASGAGSERVFRAARTDQRDLAVLVLVDGSLSTESWVGTGRVLDVEKEALLALTAGLAACGDAHEVLVFTSRRRHAVWVRRVKAFDEPPGAAVARRILALRPGHYTRMGAAIRHAARGLADRPETHRLLLLLSDGKPNDADHYEGRYAVEDTRRAIREARRAGIRVFGITIDQEARDYVPALFGQGAYTIIADAARLTAALPRLYRQVTA